MGQEESGGGARRAFPPLSPCLFSFRFVVCLSLSLSFSFVLAFSSSFPVCVLKFLPVFLRTKITFFLFSFSRLSLSSLSTAAASLSRSLFTVFFKLFYFFLHKDTTRGKERKGKEIKKRENNNKSLSFSFFPLPFSFSFPLLFLALPLQKKNKDAGISIESTLLPHALKTHPSLKGNKRNRKKTGKGFSKKRVISRTHRSIF